MKDLIDLLKQLPASLSVFVLIILCLFLIILRLDSITKFFKWISGKAVKKIKRTCGDCVLILFGIREKYEYEMRRLDTSLLRLQMKFAEQKIQEIIFFLSQSFAEDIKIYGKESNNERKVIQSALYCEALKNSLLSVKDELRRSFKENGFGQFSEVEFSHYVKDKTKLMLTMVRSYLNQYYVDNDTTIVHLKERFERLDKTSMQQFESWAFEVFTNAKDLFDDVRDSKKEISEKLKSEIDQFVKNGQNTTDC